MTRLLIDAVVFTTARLPLKVARARQPAPGREALLSWAGEPPAGRQVRDEQLVKALCYGFLPKERALARLREEKAGHEEKLDLYEEFERGLEVELWEGWISEEAYLGTLLTLRRGIGAERSYVEWCEEAAKLISSVERHPANGPRTS